MEETWRGDGQHQPFGSDVGGVEAVYFAHLLDLILSGIVEGGRVGAGFFKVVFVVDLAVKGGGVVGASLNRR